MKTILIANQKGGCGKTLVVDELAFSFDRTDVKYSLYDLDGQGGIIHEPKVIDDADYAIVDTPGYISDNLGELIQGADLIIIPTRTTYKDIPTLQTMLELIEQNGKSSDTMFIFNAWNRFNAAAAFEDWFKTVRDGRHVSIIPQSEEFAKAGMYGKSVVEYSPRSKAALMTCKTTRGWINYFGIGYMKWLCKDMDALIRRRLRMCIWVHWKTPQNRAQNLMKLGMYSKKAYAIAYSGARVARLSEGALNYVITNKRLASFGLVSMYDYYTERFVKC